MMSVTAWGTKLLQHLVVWQELLYVLTDGSRVIKKILCLKLFYILQFTVAVVPLHHFFACAERSNRH